MSDNEVTNELKAKGLPVFGTKVERVNRLRKELGE